MTGKTTRRSLFKEIGGMLQRSFGGQREPEVPGDPLAYPHAPVRRSPNSRSGVEVVAELDEENGSSAPGRSSLHTRT